MSLLVTGTIGIDTVETPHGRADDVLGGSAVYFSFAASLLTPVRLVGAVGDDFPKGFLDLLSQARIDTAGLEVRKGSRSFRWHGKYLDDMNLRETLRTDLNVVAEAPPRIPPAFRDSSYVFLANTHPAIQRGFIAQLSSPKLIVCDTMDLWIKEAREELMETLRAVHGVVLNDAEARQLTGQSDLIRAAQAVLTYGPRLAVVKKGEHGALLMTKEDCVVMPAYPTFAVKDPTGAGDSFAGGMLGYLSSVDRVDLPALKKALVYGACVASITIEGFSLDALRAASRPALERRLQEFKAMLSID